MSKFLFITKPFLIEPLGVMYLSSSLKAADHQVFWETTGDNLADRVHRIRPSFVGYSVLTGDHKFFADVNKGLKEKLDFFAVAGGPHPTFFPEYIKDSSFDAVCRGESELALVDLVSRFSGGRYEFPNLWFNTPEGIKENGVRCLVSDLDDLPFPDRKLVYDVDEKQRNNPIKHFIASRGCPFACNYCFNHAYKNLYKGKGEHVRFRSVDNVLDEVEQVVRDYPSKFVYFHDDTFIIKKGWLEEFSRKYAKRINLPFNCNIRANIVDEDTIRLLKDANCYYVQMAIESGNERLRNKVLKRGMSEKQIYHTCDLLHKYDIKFLIHNMIGLPTGTLEDDLETLKMNIKCRPTYGWVSIFQPYPGTGLAELCLEEKLISEKDLDAIQSNFFDATVLDIEDKKEVEYLQKLFAITVRYPVIYHSGLLKLLLKMPDTPAIRDVLSNLYKSFRKSSDEKLYGMKI